MISIVIISKDEPSLGETLSQVTRQVKDYGGPVEILVIDASDGRLDDIRKRHHHEVGWVQFDPPPGVRVSIPHQRNVGVRAARGDVIVFTDSGCRPQERWLERLVAPLLSGEYVTAGVTLADSDKPGLYDGPIDEDGREARYLRECATINLAFRKEAFEAVGGFDERFAYGSDVDFSWRLIDAGYRIRSVPDAVVTHDWGTWKRQVRRSYAYGKARARLYRKHPARLRRILLDDPIVIVYPAFLLGLPLTIIFPLYPALLLIPAWRNRSLGAVRVVTDHLVYGAGVLAELLPG